MSEVTVDRAIHGTLTDGSYTVITEGMVTVFDGTTVATAALYGRTFEWQGIPRTDTLRRAFVAAERWVNDRRVGAS